MKDVDPEAKATAAAQKVDRRVPGSEQVQDGSIKLVILVARQICNRLHPRI
jgi:hypothetical protein